MNFDHGVWILGAGGIGCALANKCKQLGIDVRLFARPEFNLTQQQDVAQLFERINRLPSVIVNTIGTLYHAEYMPEKSVSAFDANWFLESMRVNAMPVMWFAQMLNTRLSKSNQLIFINLSARVSSISDNRLGGWHSYRASKCALNMLIKNISIEWARRFPNVSICGYHPGTVDTNLSAPFKKNVKPENLFSSSLAADYLFAQIERTTPAMSGNLFDWRGESIAF